MSRLGVNIDHVATLRQQREEGYPSLVEAARVCLESGADQITIHLREDRRHIQDTDVGAIKLVTQRYSKPLNLEMGCAEEIIDVAIATKPEWVCLVPEKREEKTTEGGLNLMSDEQFNKIKRTCEVLKDKNPKGKISLFIEHKQEILDKAVSLPIDAVEIHTGDYARDFLHNNDISNYLDEFSQAKEFIESRNIGFHAGHGLTNQSVKPLTEKNLFAEYNIGHWIVCESVFRGMDNVVKDLKKLLN
jgi:pyridoxine 5-phosphate synthase